MPEPRSTDPTGPGGRFLRVVIPAHDEQRVIGGLVSDLRRQDYPDDCYQVWVLADRCADDTARVAARGGARVVERHRGPDGKGELLKWHLSNHPLEADEALVVLDADNRVDEDFLSLLSSALRGGAQVVQASVLASNLQASAVAAAAGLGDWMAREMIHKKAARRGWPVELGGTGFCITSEALAAAGGWSGSLTEDLDLTVRLLLVGHTIHYLPQARVWDEKPTSLGAAVGQRRRWAQGRTGVRKRRGGSLWKAALVRRSLSLGAMAWRLATPGRSFRLVATMVLAVLSVLWGWGFPVSWPVWAAIALWLGGRPLWSLWRVKEVRPLLRWYPLTLIWGFVWIWVRIGPRRNSWYHTPHHGSVGRDD
ncbi:MAG: glycosyltransferase [bacterium]|nr:glycosyltransferase [Acidimicrobiia bacterium]MCY4650218.1 glycosyltransferase [bacterium]